MNFEFATANRIVFGPGTLAGIGPLAAELGRFALVVTGSDPSRAERLLALLEAQGIGNVTFPVHGEPDIETVQDGLTLARQEGCDLVIGFGGGSALDAGKTVAAMMTNDGELTDYLEVIGKGIPLAVPSAPFIAIPTTAGTGTEVTRNAVLSSPEHRVKVSLRSPFLLPRIALVDPELAWDLPRAITASTGLDALTQLIEPWVSPRANAITDALCRDGIPRVAKALPAACEDGRNATAREEMALGALLGGLALANAGLGAVHGLANPIGGMFQAPHGVICAALLAPVIEANCNALRLRETNSPSLPRYKALGRLLTGRADATALDAAAWIRQLVTGLRIPGLGQFGVTAKHTDELVEKALRASSMKANPIALTHAELAGVLARAL